MRIEDGEIHAWMARFSTQPGALDESMAICDAGERRHAQRLNFAYDRQRFLAARAFLRRTLARYVGMAAQELRFRYGSFGKPAVANAGEIEFSCSRSGALFAVAVSRTALGLDVEEIRPGAWTAEVAAVLFTQRERECLAALPETLRTQAFYRAWVAKEACVKACGRGLSVPLDGFSVASALEEPRGGRSGVPVMADGSVWSLHGVDAIPGYAMAVAATRAPAALRLFWR